jgi:hypothetical protein
MNSTTGASDHTGDPTFVISPNRNNVNPIESDAGKYTLGLLEYAPKEPAGALPAAEPPAARSVPELTGGPSPERRTGKKARGILPEGGVGRAMRNRQSVDRTAEDVHRLRAKVGDGVVTADHVRELATLLAAHSVKELRQLKAKLGVQVSRDADKEWLVGELANRSLRWAKGRMDAVKAGRAKRELTARLRKAGHTGTDEHGRTWEGGKIVTPKAAEQPAAASGAKPSQPFSTIGEVNAHIDDLPDVITRADQRAFLDRLPHEPYDAFGTGPMTQAEMRVLAKLPPDELTASERADLQKYGPKTKPTPPPSATPSPAAPDEPEYQYHGGSRFDAGEDTHEGPHHRAVNDVLTSAGRRFPETQVGPRARHDDTDGELASLDEHMHRLSGGEGEGPSPFLALSGAHAEAVKRVEAGEFDSEDHDFQKPEELGHDAAGEVGSDDWYDHFGLAANGHLDHAQWAERHHEKLKKALQDDIRRRVMERHAPGGPASRDALADKDAAFDPHDMAGQIKAALSGSDKEKSWAVRERFNALDGRQKQRVADAHGGGLHPVNIADSLDRHFRQHESAEQDAKRGGFYYDPQTKKLALHPDHVDKAEQRVADLKQQADALEKKATSQAVGAKEAKKAATEAKQLRKGIADAEKMIAAHKGSVAGPTVTVPPAPASTAPEGDGYSHLPRAVQAEKQHDFEHGHDPSVRKFAKKVADLRAAGGTDKDVQDLINLYAPDKASPQSPVFQQAEASSVDSPQTPAGGESHYLFATRGSQKVPVAGPYANQEEAERDANNVRHHLATKFATSFVDGLAYGKTTDAAAKKAFEDRIVQTVPEFHKKPAAPPAPAAPADPVPARTESAADESGKPGGANRLGHVAGEMLRTALHDHNDRVSDERIDAALSPLSKADVTVALQRMGVPATGNLTKKEMIAQAKMLARHLDGAKNFVKQRGHDLPPPAPVAPAEAVPARTGGEMTAEAVKRLYETAESPDVTHEHIAAAVAGLDGLKKAELQEVAKSINHLHGKGDSAATLRKAIADRLKRRKGIAVRDSIADGNPWVSPSQRQGDSPAPAPETPPGKPAGAGEAGSPAPVGGAETHTDAAAERLGVAPRTVRMWLDNGRLPRSEGGHVAMDAAGLDHFQANPDQYPAGRHTAPESGTAGGVSPVSSGTDREEGSAEPSVQSAGPYTLAEHDAVRDRLADGTVTADELRAAHARLQEHRDAVQGELKKRTVPELRKLAGHWRASDMNKPELLNYLHERMGEDLIPSTGESRMISIGRDYDPVKEQTARLAQTTGEHVQKHAERVGAARAELKAKIDAAKAGMDNPQTLDDFRRLERTAGGYDKMSPEHQARYDELHADQRRGRSMAERQEKAKVEGFSGGEAAAGGIGIVDGHHQKRNAPTHTVTVENRLGSEKFAEALSAAKRLGGSYVNANIARQYGATPGFQFFDRQKAEQFAAVLRGESVDWSADVAGEMAGRLQNRAGTLAERGQALEQAGQEAYSADRRENTYRQSAMAASARAEAQNKIAHGRTLQALGEGQASGELKHLNGVRSAEDLHTLDRTLRAARWDRLRAAEKAKAGGLSHAEREEMQHAPHSHEDVTAVQFPHPTAHQSELRHIAQSLRDEPGLKRFAEKMAKEGDPHAEVKFQGSVGGMKANGGRLLGEEHFKDHKDAAEVASYLKDADGEPGMVRTHASYDWRLAQAAEKSGTSGRGPFHTADKGKTWATTPEGAVFAAINKGNQLDIVKRPEDKVVKFTDADDIDALRTAARKLSRHADDRLRRIGSGLKEKLEHHDRLKRADIHSTPELRAALREYLPLRKSADKEDPVKAAERELKGRDIPGFFPTPRPVIEDMLDRADIQPGHSVLEPSAGKGDILDAIRERHPDAHTHAVEPVSSLRDILQKKGHALVGHDVMEHGGEYDRVVMNPPFENGQDREHVQRAFDLLKPGGKLVAVMSEGPFQRSGKKDQEFRDWLDSVGGESEPMPEGSFAGNDAFRKTGVRTRMVTIGKPHDAASVPARTGVDSPADLAAAVGESVAGLHPPEPAAPTPADVPEHATPRERAEAHTKAAQSDYAFARQSAVPNAGEDLMGSARHVRNQWRGLAEAEADGTAAAMVTRDNLLKNEPHALDETLEPHNALSHLAAHLALNAFPDHPGDYPAGYARYKDRNGQPLGRKSPEELRSQYLDAYRAVKAKAEHLAETETDPKKVLQGIADETRRQINIARGLKPEAKGLIETSAATDPYNPVANALIALHNRAVGSGSKKTHLMSRVHEFAGHVQKRYGEPKAEHLADIAEHVRDVMDGHSMNKTFGAEGKAKRNFNPVDAYVGHVVRKGGRVIDAATVKAGTEFVMSHLGMRGLQYGNSVSDDERQHHLSRTAEALADLADVTGLPDHAASIGGKLGLAIGARGKGKASAHYEPDTKVINLTRKNGAGTLAHEWAHALDHHLNGGGFVHRGGKRRGDFLSADHHKLHAGKDDPVVAAMAGVRAAMRESGFHSRLPGVVRSLQKQGMMHTQFGGVPASEYWTSPEEMFARTFERHVQHKLRGADRDNTYLSGIGEGKEWHELWPTKEEAEKMAPAMDALMQAIRDKHFADHPA